MSGWAKVEAGNVRIIHHSTASVITIEIKKREETQQGKYEDVIIDIGLEYSEFSDLRDAINLIDFP